MKKTRKRFIPVVLGLLLVIISMLTTSYSVGRLVICLSGMFFVILIILLSKKNKFIKIILSLLLIIFSFLLDMTLSYFKLHEPVLGFMYVSSDNMKTINSLSYRVYYCSDKTIFDFYNDLEYPCGEEDINQMDINSFLNTVDEDFLNFKNKFIKVTGKISKVDGSNILEMSTYEVTDESINGHVAFGDNLNLKIIFHNNLDHIYNIYDNVSVIGRVSKIIKDDDIYTIIMEDSVIKENNLYKDYEILLDFNNECDSVSKYLETDDYIINSLCVNNVRLKYDDANIYDLSYVLQDKKITFNEFLDKANDSVGGYNTLYEFDNFNVLSCKDNNNVYIGNRYLSLDNDYCPKLEETEIN